MSRPAPQSHHNNLNINQRNVLNDLVPLFFVRLPNNLVSWVRIGEERSPTLVKLIIGGEPCTDEMWNKYLDENKTLLKRGNLWNYPNIADFLNYFLPFEVTRFNIRGVLRDLKLTLFHPEPKPKKVARSIPEILAEQRREFLNGMKSAINDAGDTVDSLATRLTIAEAEIGTLKAAVKSLGDARIKSDADVKMILAHLTWKNPNWTEQTGERRSDDPLPGRTQDQSS